MAAVFKQELHSLSSRPWAGARLRGAGGQAETGRGSWLPLPPHLACCLGHPLAFQRPHEVPAAPWDGLLPAPGLQGPPAHLPGLHAAPLPPPAMTTVVCRFPGNKAASCHSSYSPATLPVWQGHPTLSGTGRKGKGVSPQHEWWFLNPEMTRFPAPAREEIKTCSLHPNKGDGRGANAGPGHCGHTKGSPVICTPTGGETK